MTDEFRRTGDLKSIGSYPVWLQTVVHETSPHKRRVVEHELFSLMRDAKLVQIYEGTSQIQRMVMARELLRS